MTEASRDVVTRLLLKWGQGDEAALEKLLPLVYDDLRRIAGRRMRSERPNHTLQATELVHEAYLRLIEQNRVDWRNRAQFFAVGARAMRRVLVDHARKRAAKRRIPTVGELGEGARVAAENDANILALDEALTRLTVKHPRQSRVIELRRFGELTIEETAQALDVSPSTVKNDERAAFKWLRTELKKGTSDELAENGPGAGKL